MVRIGTSGWWAVWANGRPVGTSPAEDDANNCDALRRRIDLLAAMDVTDWFPAGVGPARGGAHDPTAL